jgi:hypothetical protein
VKVSVHGSGRGKLADLPLLTAHSIQVWRFF